jgi:PiT family inorganic phosphate transporter
VDPLLIATLIFGAYAAWNIGANDVANAMGTSVGSGALTFRRAIILAAIFEFAGAVLVGGHVTQTVQRGIIDAQIFADAPMQLAIGMSGALLASAIWLNLASWLGWPVSTTHAIVGAVAGFGMVAGGAAAVDWARMGSIVASWVVSPVVGGLIGFATFHLIRRLILEQDEPHEAAARWGPWMLLPVGAILTLSFLYKGLKNLKLDLPFGEAAVLSLIVGAVLAAVALYMFPQMIRRSMRGDRREGGMDPRYIAVERVFVVLQVATACMVAFAHGSNDVANAVGPVAAVWEITHTGVLTAKVGVPLWILAMGGVGIVVGLATFGYRVIRTIGREITEMTPTRGFAAEFGAATTILLGSRLGMPISTTHTLVGAVIGVGLARGIAAIDTGVVRTIALSWVATVPFTAGLSGVFYVLLTHLMAR